MNGIEYCASIGTPDFEKATAHYMERLGKGEVSKTPRADSLKAVLGNEVFAKFKKNFEYYRPEENLEDYLSATLVEDVLGCTFAWEYTPEGFDYWMDVESNYLKAVL